jgi:hypothetical protein
MLLIVDGHCSLENTTAAWVLDALAQSCKSSNIKARFRRAGIPPLNTNAALNNSYIPEEPYPFINRIRSISRINNKVLFDIEIMQTMASKITTEHLDSSGHLCMEAIITSLQHDHGK